MSREASARHTKYGLVYDGDGWFVLNARETRWRDTGPLGFYCDFEGKRRFPQIGVTLNVLEPGQPMGMYHRENGQEGFLVLFGECLLIVEDEERRLKSWDFFHCPPGTEHAIVGAGEGRSVVLALGRRGLRRKGLVYPVSETALRHRTGVEHETTDWAEVYARLGPWTRTAYRSGWLPPL